MVEPLDERQQECWRAYIESSWALQTHLEEDLRARTGLSMSDYHVLVVLSEAPSRRLRMGELAGFMVFSPSRVTYQITSMVKRGLVRRESCPGDRRGQEAVLTDEGMAALVAAAPLHLATVRDSLMDDLDDAEVAVLARVFTRLGTRLRPAGTGARRHPCATDRPLRRDPHLA
ncbi:MarR family transcriptional regulator [Actinoplanes sp. NPDC051346]|uniref:MarR family winged helix-turn-helix transcriptional regulator n=1 Tax=Actinoplanes sp. NPDC051346 TaxID=3155048 RepID=UPI00342075A0